MKITDLLNNSLPIDSTVKPLRKRIGGWQVAVLQAIFARGVHFPDRQLRMQLSSQLQLSSRTIQVWFQNQRQAHKARHLNTTTIGITTGILNDSTTEVSSLVPSEVSSEVTAGLILQSLRNSVQ